MKKMISLFALLVSFLASGADVFAHSTAGLSKEPLAKEVVEVNDVAYYIEPYIAGLRDENGKNNRWFVVDFGLVEQWGNRAVVHFSVMDQKTGVVAERSMTFLRNPDGKWSHVDDKGVVVAKVVDTYVAKPNVRKMIGLSLAALLATGYGIAKVVEVRRRRAESKTKAVQASSAA